MKTIGTLEEIGAQVGDVVECVKWDGDFYRAGSQYQVVEFGSIVGTSIEVYCVLGNWRIISRASKSPIRTVTRKEIVPGIYGRENVADTAGQWIEIELVGEYGHTGCPRLTASDLTAAIKTLTEIRDAMENT